jgi:hypothetical protein
MKMQAIYFFFIFILTNKKIFLSGKTLKIRLEEINDNNFSNNEDYEKNFLNYLPEDQYNQYDNSNYNHNSNNYHDNDILLNNNNIHEYDTIDYLINSYKLLLKEKLLLQENLENNNHNHYQPLSELRIRKGRNLRYDR